MRKFLVILLLCSLGAAQEIKRPTVESDPGASTKYGCSGQYYTATPAMPLAHDAAGIPTGSSIGIATTSPYALGYRNRIFKTWQTTGNTYSALSLNVNSSNTACSIAGVSYIKYSLDNGVSWTNLITNTACTGYAQKTSTVALSAGQNLSKLQVSVCVGVVTGDFETTEIFDIWTAGTTPPAASGSGNSSGIRRGTIFIF